MKSPFRTASRARAMVASLALCAAAALSGCGARERSNPLDPLNSETHGTLPGLQFQSSHDRVVLRWDPLTGLTPVPNVRIERRAAGDSGFVLLTLTPIASGSFVDSTVQDGRDYLFRVTAVSPEGHAGTARVDTATPGPEIAWVADEAADRVIAVAPDARSILRANEGLSSPSSVSFDPVRAELWIADLFDGLVIEEDSSGAQRGRYSVLAFPRFVAADPRHGGCWAADQQNGQVVRVAPGGAVEAVADSFAGPTALGVDPDGGVWVAEGNAGRVTKVRPDGTRQVTLRGLSLPLAVLVDPGSEGGSGGARTPSVWIADYTTGQLARATLDGRLIYRLAGFPGAAALAADSASGSLWVSMAPQPGDPGVPAVARLDPNGRRVWQVGGFFAPVDLAVDVNDLSIWVADAAANAVWRVGPTGAPLRRLGGLSFPRSITIDPGPRTLRPTQPAAAASRRIPPKHATVRPNH